jgi:very-short-patch-repair endonuclease
LKKLGSRGRRIGALAAILDDCATRTRPLESALEVRMWTLLRKAKFPVPRGGYGFQDDDGQPGRIDIAYPEQRLAIECDGYEHHGTREAFENDRVRTTRLAALGWRVFPVTWKQLDEQPMEVLKRVSEALRA